MISTAITSMVKCAHCNEMVITPKSIIEDANWLEQNVAMVIECFNCKKDFNIDMDIRIIISI